MKRFLIIAAMMLGAAVSANAQWFDFSNNAARAEAGFIAGEAGSTTIR